MCLKVDSNTNSVEYTAIAKNKSQIIYPVSPSFKGGPDMLFNGIGGFMQMVENGGFLASFLIQDTLGMTLPRTLTGFNRDREVTGHYNMQEGFEVLGREGLTGPCMMAVAPLFLLCSAKLAGKSTSINTELIKRFGNSLKTIVSKPDFDKSLLRNAEQFRKDFYKKNIEDILKNSLGEKNVSKESVDYILKELEKYHNIPANEKLHWFRGKAKYRNERISNIVEHIDNIRYNTSSELESLKKVKISNGLNGNDIKTMDTANVLEGLIKYTDDAIYANKHLANLDESMAESIKNKSVAKRFITNISMLASTLGVLSVLPKIYARSNVAPGARKNIQTENDNKNEQNVSFKGKNPLDKLGKRLSEVKSDFVHSELEYNGHNFTKTLMAGLSLLGLLLPRGLRAYNRAQVDDNGKKDLTELWEILIRDVSSSLAVVFAVPMATKACVTSYENKSGFVLLNKNRNMSKGKTFLDLLNPYSGTQVLSNSELKALYNNIDSHAKMMNFCKYIDKNGGDLQKIISKSGNAQSVFNSSTFTLDSIKSMSKKEKNAKIMKAIEDLGKKPNSDNIIKKLMNDCNTKKLSSITKFARNLYSVPGALATVFVVPYLLGVLIPRITYANTRRIHEKQDREKEQNQIALRA